MLTLAELRLLTNWSTEERKDWTSGLDEPSCREPHVWTREASQVRIQTDETKESLFISSSGITTQTDASADKLQTMIK